MLQFVLPFRSSNTLAV